MPTFLLRIAQSIIVCLFLQPAASAGAEACGVLVRITFTEDLPDSFLIEFLEGEGFDLSGLDLDLTPSAGRAHIDTPYSKAHRTGANGIVLAETLGFTPGSRRMAFKFNNFPVGKTYSLVVDLDGYADQLYSGELYGARAVVHFVGHQGVSLTVQGEFGTDGVAELGNRACA